MPRVFHDVMSRDKAVRKILGSFAPNGTSAVSAASNKGTGWSVARSGVGTFTITFEERYPELLLANATLQLSAAADSVVQFGDYTAASRTLVLRILTAGAAADVAANANNRVNFELTFRDSSVVR